MVATEPGAPEAYRTRVAELPEGERPRERLERLGPQALKSDELLAILLRTGTARDDVLEVAQRLLRDRDGLRGLAASDVPGLAAVHGVGQAKATTIAAAFELGRRVGALEGETRPQVTGPEDIARLLQPEMELLQQEELRLLVLDTKHRVLAAPTLYRGTVSAAPGRVAELFREAVRRNASKIAIAHNHPSGDPTPSPDDIEFTRAAVEAGRLLEIDVLDHVVIGHGPRRWVSLRQRRLGFG
ncbi:MAG: DNA repair protein RadC [Chloroflexi bacterium]|nr:DNA repair protein RadC [Chloroflexota bacterium]MDA1241476.1 DNA repair protein RadC [Chloroflexota bacterium]